MNNECLISSDQIDVTNRATINDISRKTSRKKSNSFEYQNVAIWLNPEEIDPFIFQHVF